jgi:molybdopterin converting factor small subunit
MAPAQSATMNVTVKLFGPEARQASRPEVSVTVAHDARAIDVLEALEKACGPLEGKIAHCRLAVNHEFVDPFKRVSAGDELALIGMVSGG